MGKKFVLKQLEICWNKRNMNAVQPAGLQPGAVESETGSQEKSI
jgi:hypothetical protein